MIVLNQKDIDKSLSMSQCIDGVIEAYSLSFENKVNSPLRTGLVSKINKGTALFMPGFIEEKGMLGIKIVSVFPENIKLGKKVINGSIIMLDEKTGETRAILDGGYVTQLRTGAATGASIRLLANKEVKIGVLFGTGGQAPKQLEAMLCERQFEEIRIVGRNFEKTKAFALQMDSVIKTMNIDPSHKNVKLKALENGDEAVKDADIIILATTSTTGLFDGNFLKQGVHICGVGSYTKDMKEMDQTTILRADKIFIDQKEAILSEAGEFIQLIDKGIISKAFYTAELGEVALSLKKGRENKEEITIFKSVGIAAQDLVSADKIYKNAIKLGLGQKVDF